MGLRYRRSIRLGKYLKLNIGKSSVGLSAGVRGAHMSVNSKGRKTTSVGIPGTGISYVKASTIGKSGHKASGNPYPVQPQNNFSPTETAALPPPPDGMIRVGKKDYKPEALKKLSTVILVLSVLIIITSFCIMPIGILFLVFGLILFYFGNTYRKVVKAYRSNQTIPIPVSRTDSAADQLTFRTVIHEYNNCSSYPSSFTVFDLETTGLDASTEKIIEIGAIKYREGIESDRFQTFVNPQKPIPQSASNVNHIYDNMVKGAPLINEVLPQFMAFIGSDVLVAHNASFDIKFIQTELSRRIDNEVIDTLALSRRCIKALPNYKLETLKAYLHMDEPSHRAIDDCNVTAKLYLHCKELNPSAEKAPIAQCETEKQPMSELQQQYYDTVISILKESGRNIDQIDYIIRPVYFDIDNMFTVCRFKLNGKLKYWLIDMDSKAFSDVAGDKMEFSPASNKEGLSKTRVFIKSPDDLYKFRDIIIDSFDKSETSKKIYLSPHTMSYEIRL